MDLEALAARHRAAAAAAGDPPVKNIVPSLRDFTRYVTTGRQELAVIGELRRLDPDRGRLGEVADAAAFARAVEEGGAYGVCVNVLPEFGGSSDDLRAVAPAVQLPVLARGMVLEEPDLYRLRGAGADAAVLHAALHAPARIAELRKAARSMHMELLVEAGDDASLDAAIASGVPVIGVSGVDANGAPALDRAKTMLARIPEGRVPILVGGIATVEELAPLLALVDAVVLVEPVMAAAAAGGPDAIAAVVEPFTNAV